MTNTIFQRTYYLDKVRGFYKSDLIKVISGIRRCGKSCFMLSIIDDLQSQGVSASDILYLNLDMRSYKNIKTPKQLEDVIASFVTDNNFKYIFIDEVQNVKGFEEVVNSFREEGNCSIFITGSNSYLLSGELVTKLTGRYIEIEMFTLSFFEFVQMKRFLGKPVSANPMDEFTQYIRFGGFPKTLEFDNDEDKLTYVNNVIGQIMQKDISKHRRIQNKSVFEKVKTYIVNNFGATTSITNIVEHFEKHQHIAIKRETINNYIQILQDAKLIYKCPRFDVKSKKSLAGEQKYYLADLGLYFATNVDNRINYGPVLENILYTYLRMKGYQVSVGKIGKLECDFIVRKNADYYYAQVSMSIMDEHTANREYEPFNHIRDNYPKYLFTIDQLLQNRNGIINANLIDFILSNKNL